MEKNPYKKFILDIVKELKDDTILFNQNTLNYLIEDLIDRIETYELDVDCMEAEETPGWKGGRKILKRWNSLLNKASNFLNPKSKQIESLSQEAKKLGFKLTPNKN